MDKVENISQLTQTLTNLLAFTKLFHQIVPKL